MDQSFRCSYRGPRRGKWALTAKRRSNVAKRRGNIVVLTAVMIVVLLLVAAFAIDIGMIGVARSELQRTADSAALAATDELLHQLTLQTSQANAWKDPNIQSAAVSFAKINEVGRVAPDVQLNPANAITGQIVAGEMVRLGNGTASLSQSDPSRYNSVAVTVKRTSDQNGEIGMFFGRVAGVNSVGVEAQAQAAFLQDFAGFRVPSGNTDPPPTVMILPFAISHQAWDGAKKGLGTDNYGWDSEHKEVTQVGDGVPEINLYPLDTGASGNFGTVDIGSNNSKNGDLQRQIVDGLTQKDLDFHGGQLALDQNGELILSGDPGMKVGPVQSALEKIVGQNRILPLYKSVSGNGQNAQFTIDGFAGGRIMDVKLNGNNKYLKVQPASIITRGGIPAKSGGTQQVYSPVLLVR